MESRRKKHPAAPSALFLVSLGCSKNLVDTEVIAGTLLSSGRTLAFDPEEADQLDLQFHLTLMEATGNRILKIFGQVLILMFDRKYRTKFLNPAAVRKSVGDHRAMLKALSEGSESRLTELIRQHIQPL